MENKGAAQRIVTVALARSLAADFMIILFHLIFLSPTWAAESCGGDGLCLKWLQLIQDREEEVSPLSWMDLLSQHHAYPKLTMTNHGGKLVLLNQSRSEGLFSPFARLFGNGKANRNNEVALLDGRTTSALVPEVRAKMISPHHWLVHTTAPSIVLPSGPVLVLRQPTKADSGRPQHMTSGMTILDLSGGCCRNRETIPPVGRKQLFKLSQKAPHLGPSPAWVRHQQLHHLAYDAVDAVEHEAVYSLMQGHGSTYFHSMAEAAPRLLWGIRMLRDNPKIRVVTSGSAVLAFLDLVGLPGRGLHPVGKAVFSAAVTIPPPGAEGQSMLVGEDIVSSRRLLRAILRSLRTLVPLASKHESAASGHIPAPRSIIVIHRAAETRRNGRAMLNHDEVMATFRCIFFDRKTKSAASLAEWPPKATLQEAVAAWGGARVAIAPHGAGGTNMIFMQAGGTYVEILAEGQRGRVYGQLATRMGLKYVPCIYNRADPRFRPQMADHFGSDNFVVDIPWLLGCLHKGLNATRRTAADPFGADVWERLDTALIAAGPPRDAEIPMSSGGRSRPWRSAKRHVLKGLHVRRNRTRVR